MKKISFLILIFFSLSSLAQVSSGELITKTSVENLFNNIYSGITHPNYSGNNGITANPLATGGVIELEYFNNEINKLNNIGFNISLLSGGTINSNTINQKRIEMNNAVNELNNPIIIENNVRKYYDNTVASSCNEYKNYNNGRKAFTGTHATSGLYSINIDGNIKTVYCDMDTENGGWTLMASTWISAYDSTISTNKPDIYSLGQFIVSNGTGNVPTYTEMRHFCRKSDTDIVHKKRVTAATQDLNVFNGNLLANTESNFTDHNFGGVANWSHSGGSYTELHHYFGEGWRFILRSGQVHCGVNYSSVGGQNNNSNLGQEGYIYVR